MQELLWKKGINWNDYPVFFKRGTFIRRRKVVRAFSAAERASPPEKHAARSDPALVVERTQCGPFELPPLSKVENRVGVLFRAENPQPRGSAGAGPVID
jgi:hypothetical protein